MPGSGRRGGAELGAGAPDLASYLEGRFGIPTSALSGYAIVRRGSSYWAFSGDANALGSLERVESIGMRAARFKGGILRPTTAFIRLVGRHATRNVVELSDERDAMIFMEGGILRGEFRAEPGFVIVRYRGDVLGYGIYSARLGVVSQVPSHMRARSDWGASASEE